ncbi:MAG: leucine-rich repeat protein [Clostridia bacterium]|nr:leucine-rich repeat protein [Clostridia bacterium]
MIKNKMKITAFLLVIVIVFSCFSLCRLSAEESDIFKYHISNQTAILTGLKSSASGAIVVPDKLGGYDVVSVEGAFYDNTKITSVVLPDTVNTITSNSFAYCSKLKSIDLPQSLSFIGEAAFCGCVALEEVVLPEGVTQVGPYAFSWCEKLSAVTLPTTLETLERGVFSGCSSLNSIDIPEEINCVMQDALDQTGFYKNEENWENGVLYSGRYLIAARNTELGVCEVKPGTKTIAERAFSMCTSLTGVIIYKDLEFIGRAAFNGCKNIKDVYYSGDTTDRRRLDVGANNDYLTRADVTWHYYYDPDIKEYAPGDINGDDKINNKDALRLLKYLSDWPVEVIDSVLDVNGDGNTNNKDVSRLFQYLSGWDVKIYSRNVGYEYDDEDYGPAISF